MNKSSRRLTATDIPKIRKMLAKGDKQHDIAARFGVNQGRISEINTGQAWNDLNDRRPPRQASFPV
jgi:hypothetical protein